MWDREKWGFLGFVFIYIWEGDLGRVGRFGVRLFRVGRAIFRFFVFFERGSNYYAMFVGDIF